MKQLERELPNGRDVALGSDLAVPITPGGGPLSEAKLKQRKRKPTFGLELPVLGVLLPWLAQARDSRV